MTSSLSTSGDKDSKYSASDRRRARQYIKELVPGLAVYAILLIASQLILKRHDDSTVGRALFMFTPVIPIVLIGRAIVRSLRRADEFQQLETYKAIAFSFAVAMVVSVMLGFASSVFKLDARPVAWAPFMGGMGTWAVGSVLYLRRAPDSGVQ